MGKDLKLSYETSLGELRNNFLDLTVRVQAQNALRMPGSTLSGIGLDAANFLGWVTLK